MVFDTRWELNPGHVIRIPHRVPLDHGPMRFHCTSIVCKILLTIIKHGPLTFLTLQKVAMGQGQSEIAMKLLTDCARDGDWLCLKNLHLVTAWLPKLEKVRLLQVICKL